MHRHDFELIKNTSFAGIYLYKKGDIILFKYKESCSINLELAQKIIDTAHNLIKKYHVELFISDNTANYITSTPEARDFLSNNKSLKIMKANAIVSKELPVRILVNSFIQNNKPIIPFKSFSSIDDAIAWLYTFKNQEVNSSKVPSL